MADAIGYQPSTRTAQNVISHVQRIFGDLDGVQLATTDIITWINDAQEQIVNRTRPLKTRSLASSVSNQAEYKFPGNNIIEIESLLYDGVRIQNIPFARAEREYIGMVPAQAPGTPVMWWEWNGSFTLFPTPSDVKTITLYYAMLAAPVVNTTDVLGVPDKYYQTVLAYVMKQAYELDENMPSSQAKGQEFSQDLADFTDEERTAQHMTYESISYVDQGF